MTSGHSGSHNDENDLIQRNHELLERAAVARKQTAEISTRPAMRRRQSACVVLIHDDRALVEDTALALSRRGHRPIVFTDPKSAQSCLATANMVDALITRAFFTDRRPSGVALALHARDHFPAIKVIFIERGSYHPYLTEIGDCLDIPVEPQSVVDVLERLLHSGEHGWPSKSVTK
jgi:hypothetical protein